MFCEKQHRIQRHIPHSSRSRTSQKAISKSPCGTFQFSTFSDRKTGRQIGQHAAQRPGQESLAVFTLRGRFRDVRSAKGHLHGLSPIGVSKVRNWQQSGQTSQVRPLFTKRGFECKLEWNGAQRQTKLVYIAWTLWYFACGWGGSGVGEWDSWISSLQTKCILNKLIILLM